MNAKETPDQYEARRTAFLKMKTRRITNALRKDYEADQRRIAYYNSPQGKEEVEAADYAASVRKDHGFGCYCGCCMY